MSLPSPRIAAIVVNYQSYGELRDCLASLLAASGPSEILVVDQASDPAAVADLQRTYPSVRFIPISDNTGFAAGVNRGAHATVADYLLLVNPDCVVAPGLPETLARWLEANPHVGVVGPTILNEDGTVQASARRFPDLTTAIAGRSSWLTRVLPSNPLSRRNLLARDAEPTPVEVDWVSGACMVVRRTAFDAVGGMDEGFFLYWEDADFCRRLKQAGWRTAYYPIATVVHVCGRSSRHAADASLVAFHRSAFRLFWKHASAPARLLAPLVFVILRARLAFMRRVVRMRARRAAG